MQALAMLDAILEEEWQYRYYSFNANWGENAQMGSMRNGSGDDFFTLFDDAGCFLKGFDHESTMSPYRETPLRTWPGVLDDVPVQFESALKEPAFSMQNTTFCIWRRAGDFTWSHGDIDYPEGEDDPDGSLWMLSALDGGPETYQSFAEDYHELEVEAGAVARVFAHEPLSAELLAAFPTSRSLRDVVLDAREIGYPVGP
ncbi:hypothetical protein C7C56_005370 [Massilia glaciei]|uniref:Uncharacterized protein n=1 Tax=Massilia glaciei TaxID=1524097 RepID=A0A2U2I4S1_9BURK|nr:hypothetical protein C7C56_005370 [Massilia glaciei]